MKALFKELPDLSQGDRKVLFDDLATTLAARPPAHGSIEAKLLDWSRRPHEYPTYNPFEQGCKPDPQPDAPAPEIVQHGFDAIPPLLELLRDNRLTAHRENPERGVGILRLRRLASKRWPIQRFPKRLGFVRCPMQQGRGLSRTNAACFKSW
jgi:hypothetical protein